MTTCNLKSHLCICFCIVDPKSAMIALSSNSSLRAPPPGAPASHRSKPLLEETMRKSVLFATLCLALAATAAFAGPSPALPPAADAKSVYDFTLKSIDGQPTPLSEYH